MNGGHEGTVADVVVARNRHEIVVRRRRRYWYWM
jgi:hypothetical protein